MAVCSSRGSWQASQALCGLTPWTAPSFNSKTQTQFISGPQTTHFGWQDENEPTEILQPQRMEETAKKKKAFPPDSVADYQSRPPISGWWAIACVVRTFQRDLITSNAKFATFTTSCLCSCQQLFPLGSNRQIMGLSRSCKRNPCLAFRRPGNRQLSRQYPKATTRGRPIPPLC